MHKWLIPEKNKDWEMRIFRESVLKRRETFHIIYCIWIDIYRYLTDDVLVENQSRCSLPGHRHPVLRSKCHLRFLFCPFCQLFYTNVFAKSLGWHASGIRWSCEQGQEKALVFYHFHLFSFLLFPTAFLFIIFTIYLPIPEWNWNEVQMKQFMWIVLTKSINHFWTISQKPRLRPRFGNVTFCNITIIKHFFISTNS